MYRYFIIISLLCIHLQSVFAQKDDANNKIQQRYATALRLFNIGNFEEADKELLSISNSSDGMLRSGALRLLALSALERGDEEKAKAYVSTLLKYDPYFTPSIGDSQRFIDMIENSKFHGSTITTASQQAETIEEVPVPVTLITEEMLHDIGARTVKEALIAYVPGMTDIASNEEMNVAMRGIYSSGQEKILFLLNGHRLNSYSTNVAIPDFSISLEKIKQIEVLRGPASSIYGGVALTGVVNIITKEGADINGLKVKLSAGNYGQMKADAIFGKRYMGLDVLAWASIYNAKGEKKYLTKEEQKFAELPVAGNIIIGGFNKMPSYDLGVNLQYNNFSLLYNRRFSKTVAPYSLSFFFTTYSYDKYRLWNGNAPGYAITSDHLEFNYTSPQNDKFAWMAKVSYDHQSQQRYQIDGDSIPEVGFNDIFVNGVPGILVKLYQGGFQSVNWNEHNLSAKFQGSLSYKLGANHPGTFLFGVEGNYFSLFDATYMEGIKYDLIIKNYNEEKVLYTGNENSADAFMQFKQRFGSSIVLNAGMRYDYKERKSGMIIHEFSPRFAFIYNNSKYNLKLSYAKSFVDAPYFYRNNTLDINFGDESLKPEYMNSWQLTFLSDRKIVPNLFIDANLFYNIAKNFIVPMELGNLNAGKVESTGLELLARYDIKKFSVSGNFTWQKVMNSDNYDVNGYRFYNIPSFQGNLLMSYTLPHDIRLHTNILFTDKQISLFSNPAGDVAEIDIPGRAVLNLGADYTYKGFEIGFNIYNLLNKQYTQGGSSIAPLQQQGRWFLANVAFNF